MIHLDTNIVVAILNGLSEQVPSRFDAALKAITPIFMSVIVFYELIYAAASGQSPLQNW